MLHVALYQPEIPPNTGNIIRLCANTGVRLHLIHPLGFAMDEKRLRRAGLDYRDLASVQEHAHWEAFRKWADKRRIWAISTKGHRSHADTDFLDEDILLFGPETSGLPAGLLDTFERSRIIRIPMRAGSRSMNLSNACAVVVFEAWRQLGFPGADPVAEGTTRSS